MSASRRATGRWALAIALLLILAAHLAHPSTGLPIYDGFVTEDPYLYLDPPPGQLGDPTSFSGVVTLDKKGRLPDLIATTNEMPPQAQIFAPAGTFTVPVGAQSFIVSITPIEPPAPAPAGSHLVGNTYEFVFTTDDGRAVPEAPHKKASVVLRGIPGDEPTVVNEYDGTTWKPLKSQTAGGTLRFANITSFGDFALIAKGPTPSPIPLASTSPGLEASPTPSPATNSSPSATLSPTPSTSPGPSATGGPQPTPSAAPGVAPPGSGSTDLPIVAALVGALAILVVVAAILIWRRRRAGEQDWRTYR